MEELKIYKKIPLINPVMITGWPGMGSVALGVVDYLIRALSATRFAEIKIDPLATLDSVIVYNGLAKIPPGPNNTFYYARNPDMIIYEGQAQIPGRQGVGLLNKVLDLAVEFNVKRIYAGAAFPVPVSYKEPPVVYGAVNERALLVNLRKIGISPMEGGQIAGLNGLVLGFAKERGIEAVCFLATMPQYAISLPNPKASGAIIEALHRLLAFDIDLKELELWIKDMDDKMALIEDRVKDVLAVEKEESKLSTYEKKIPASVMEKLEKLFHEAKNDKAKAIILKRELDRWDLYKTYEDRFLDLFKDSR